MYRSSARRLGNSTNPSLFNPAKLFLQTIQIAYPPLRQIPIKNSLSGLFAGQIRKWLGRNPSLTLYLTGELKHHQALAAQEAGLTCICLSHTISERFILKKFARQLQKQIKTITINISKKDADPFKWKTI